MKVLIAEDEVTLAHLLETQLALWGYQTVFVRDGLMALEVLRSPNAPQLALMDWLMPGLDGIEVCRQFRQDADRPYTYLVLLTGQGGRQEMCNGLEAGADDFLIKPVDHPELKARLATGWRIVTFHDHMRELAMRDALTSLYNRAAILGTLTRELERGRRESTPVGVIMADLDHFKRINDTLGHLMGDEVLRQVARRLQASMRPYDALGRYGGEEFLAVLPGCDGKDAAALAERLRACVADEPIVSSAGGILATLSLGVSAWCGGSAAKPCELLRAADLALYAAKHAGRNCVMVNEGGAPASPAQRFKRPL